MLNTNGTLHFPAAEMDESLISVLYNDAFQELPLALAFSPSTCASFCIAVGDIPIGMLKVSPNTSKE